MLRTTQIIPIIKFWTSFYSFYAKSTRFFVSSSNLSIWCVSLKASFWSDGLLPSNIPLITLLWFSTPSIWDNAFCLCSGFIITYYLLIYINIRKWKKGDLFNLPFTKLTPLRLKFNLYLFTFSLFFFIQKNGK